MEWNEMRHGYEAEAEAEMLEFKLEIVAELAGATAEAETDWIETRTGKWLLQLCYIIIAMSIIQTML